MHLWHPYGVQSPPDYTVNAKDLFFWHFQPYHLVILPHTHSRHKYGDHRADYLVPQEVNYIHLNNDDLFCKSEIFSSFNLKITDKQFLDFSSCLRLTVNHTSCFNTLNFMCRIDIIKEIIVCI